jgi:hypothetical protein
VIVGRPALRTIGEPSQTLVLEMALASSGASGFLDGA